MGPQVSVVVPTYKRPHFLAQALASARQQSLSDIEILVCDNGADRETADVVRACGDQRIHYIPRPQNLGMQRNVMLGFAQAHADIVMKLDDDDLLLPHTLESLSAPFRKHPGLAMSFGDVRLIDAAGSEMSDETTALHRASGRHTMSEGLIDHGTKSVVRGAVQLAGAALRADVVDWAAVPDEVATSYDLHLTLSAVQDECPIYYTGKTAIAYRIHGDSDTAQQLGRQARGACHALGIALASNRHADEQAIKDRLGQVSLHAGRAHIQSCEMQEGRQLLRRSMQVSPSIAAASLYGLSFLPTGLVARLSSARSNQNRRSTDRIPGR